jgi:hypothetical protein
MMMNRMGILMTQHEPGFEAHMAAAVALLRRRYTERTRAGSSTADPVIREQVLRDASRLLQLMTELGDLRNDRSLDCSKETMYYYKMAQLLLQELGCTHDAYRMGLCLTHKMGRKSVSDPPQVSADCSRRPFPLPTHYPPLT